MTSPLITDSHDSLFKDTRLEPFLNQADHPRVPDPMLQETDQPFPADRIEEASDVGIEYPVHLCAADSDNERIQRIMRAAPWPKPIRETEEIFLVVRVQDCRRCALDGFVLLGGGRGGALPPVRLGMYTRRDGSARYAPRWSR